MYASGCCSSTVPSLQPPLPMSPPEFLDLYGKRRELAKIQILEKEIGFLEEEFKSIEGLPPASILDKEVANFVVPNPDPLMPKNHESRKACRFWKWLCGISCFKSSWICCCVDCSLHLERPNCCDYKLRRCNPLNFCDYNSCNCPSYIKCSLPKYRCRWRCFSWPSCSRRFKISWRDWGL
ncbi:guanine nucleotide-binding protein subunit gamma 3-like [Malania oleifera]|uniref:guanine nucleotide-binding protein subunit gamma 3-like n=1 Tax=Malania oleifera TaxID=397392 RepID=UPI0025AE5E77|nr:guanine nucleotide-binding protein subunit gamma 3-like [Malania oleifera]